MNKFITMGRLSNDPDIRFSTNGEKAIAKFGLVCNRRGSEDAADFFNVTAFGKTAEWVEKYLRKGSKIALTGRLQSSTFEKNGENRYAVEVIAEEIEFAESKSDADARNAQNQTAAIPQGNAQGNVTLTPEQLQAAMAMMGVPQGMPQQAMPQQTAVPQQQMTQNVQQMQTMPQQQTQPQNIPQTMPQQQMTQNVQQMQAMPQQQFQNVQQAMPQQQTAPAFGQGWA